MRSIGSPRAVSISSGSWRVRGVGAQLAHEVEAVAVGQHQVEHQRVVAAAGELVAAGGQRAGGRRPRSRWPRR